MMYDVVIIGGGPAGLTAAMYASRARLKTLLVESVTVAGQAVTTGEIENYPGFPKALNGFELIDKFKKQAGKFGTEFKSEDVKSIRECASHDKKAYEIELAEESVITLSVIIATGAHPRELGVFGENRLRGKGVSYCAVCDAAFFKGKDVAVLGGGDSAVEEALFLTKFAKSVTMIHRRSRLRATKILQERALANKKIKFIWNSTINEISGKDKVEALKIKDVKTGAEKDFPCSGVFIFVGYVPNTDFLKSVLKTGENGYVITDDDMKTSKEGIFACGDARKKLLRQIVTACGDGATAAFSARIYVEELKGTAYPPTPE